MSGQFQNRLVGTVVIVALGVIFLPDLLDGKKQRQVEEFTEIPLRPVIAEQTSDDIGDGYTPETFEVEEIAATQDLAQEAKSQQVNTAPNKAAETVAKAPVNKPTAAPVKQVQPVKAGFTLQLGAFTNAQNVDGLVKQLRKNGFTAYTLPAKPIDGSLTKVFVGPELTAEKLKSYQQKIKKITGLQGKIVQYNPLEN
ncbi:SPOR domain-containing protein [Shewanella donghaensis]|uniref:SPOR domain-containing protein n=1 Tax=Shewanella donghaensis TaxID=238836 RepID=UPI001183BAA3|nr:SPOR domain-containing protein [Shewanella donghaensis]